MFDLDILVVIAHSRKYSPIILGGCCSSRTALHNVSPILLSMHPAEQKRMEREHFLGRDLHKQINFLAFDYLTSLP